ncbi:MAG: hypothetical protein P8R32_02500, partial [Candidatus Poseidoniia archaeon]|nr:hypothetical protein [Candidatus Poseidoniia archaeon]
KAVFSKIDEYFEETVDLMGNKIYRTWQLFVTGPSANQSIPKINYTNKYGMNDAGYRSLLVPGWGQFYKKNNTKGFLFLVGAAGSIGGFMYADNKHSFNMNRSLETNDLTLKRQFVVNVRLELPLILEYVGSAVLVFRRDQIGHRIGVVISKKLLESKMVEMSS